MDVDEMRCVRMQRVLSAPAFAGGGREKEVNPQRCFKIGLRKHTSETASTTRTGMIPTKRWPETALRTGLNQVSLQGPVEEGRYVLASTSLLTALSGG